MPNKKECSGYCDEAGLTCEWRDRAQALELELEQARRQIDLLQRTVDALVQPARHAPTVRERDAVAVLGCYFAFKRIATDYRAAYAGDVMAQARARYLDGRVSGAIGHMLRNDGSEIYELFRLAEVLEGLAHR